MIACVISCVEALIAIKIAIFNLFLFCMYVCVCLYWCFILGIVIDRIRYVIMRHYFWCFLKVFPLKGYIIS
jgi:hypothetical protein